MVDHATLAGAGESDEQVVARLAQTFDHLDAALTVDRSIAACKHLRERPGVAHTTSHGGYYVLTRYQDIVDAQRQAGKPSPTFSYASGILQPNFDRPKAIPIDFDEPEHGEWRKLFTNILNKAAIDEFEPAMLEEIDRFVSAFVESGGGNFSADVARRLPIAVIGRVIGWSGAVSEQLEGLVQEMMAGFHEEGSPPARDELLALCQREIDARRSTPRDDYLTRLISTEVFGRPITDAELANTLLTFIFGGYETTASVIGTLMVRLARDQALQDRLRDEPHLIGPAIEECIRLYPPVHMQFRTVTADVEIDGTVLPAGSRVGIAWVAGNHDPEVFEAPEEFRLDRPNGRQHVGYGLGAHLCAGIHLARLELLRFFEDLLSRDVRYELAGEPRHAGVMIAHDAGWTDVPIRCVPI